MTEEQKRRQKYEDISKQIDREDQLVDKRTMWLVLSEAFLFSAVASILGKALDVMLSESFCSKKWLAIGAAVIAFVLLLVGAWLAWSVAKWIGLADRQLWDLKWRFESDLSMREEYTPPFSRIDELTVAGASGKMPAHVSAHHLNMAKILTFVCLCFAVLVALSGVVFLGTAAVRCNEPKVQHLVPEKADESVRSGITVNAPPVGPAGTSITVVGSSVQISGTPSPSRGTSVVRPIRPQLEHPCCKGCCQGILGGGGVRGATEQ